jgi:hypothetical protein
MEPIACSLNDTDAARQGMDWHNLGRQALSIEVVGNRLVATWPIDAAPDVAALADREASCCGFLSIRMSRTARSARLEIASDHPSARPVIEALAAVIAT